MTKVGVNELKTHLSKYLRKVAGGEPLTITCRGSVVAVIVKVPAEDDDLHARIASMVAEGILVAPGPQPTFRGPRARLKGGSTLSSAVLEDRR